jgi:hypothetical protein
LTVIIPSKHSAGLVMFSHSVVPSRPAGNLFSLTNLLHRYLEDSLSRI